MTPDLSWKTNNFNFTPKTPSASMLTCRRRTADTPQTLTQTELLTLIPQEARKGVFSGRNGIITVLPKRAVILALFDIDFFYR
ncbi:hypothetical protein [Levilinea saccharolytica]|uniref:hypothetical protein n=1 Tax=Levilinea saccharolytica TaxID=229921 RepID=UPI0011BF665B|nr:hypothetical protein [Levilinea saccharolytica]